MNVYDTIVTHSIMENYQKNKNFRKSILQKSSKCPKQNHERRKEYDWSMTSNRMLDSLCFEKSRIDVKKSEQKLSNQRASKSKDDQFDINQTTKKIRINIVVKKSYKKSINMFLVTLMLLMKRWIANALFHVGFSKIIWLTSSCLMTFKFVKWKSSKDEGEVPLYLCSFKNWNDGTSIDQ